MKEKPKKKDKTQELCSDLTSIETLTDLIYSGYNKCIDEYEAFLPSKKEIHEIVKESCGQEYSDATRLCVPIVIAEAISKRLRGEK